MEKYGFVYIWRDSYRKMFYIGCHWGSEDDGYICSSNRMRDAYRRRPQDFKRRVITSNILNKQDMFLEEEKWLKLAKKKSKKYYNLIFNLNHSPRTIGFKHSEETKQKMRIKHLGKKMSKESCEKMSKSFTGRIVSEETKQKMSGKIPWNKGKQISTELKEKLRNSHPGVKQSAETIAKRIVSRKGYKHSEETKQKISIALKNKSNPANL